MCAHRNSQCAHVYFSLTLSGLLFCYFLSLTNASFNNGFSGTPNLSHFFPSLHTFSEVGIIERSWSEGKKMGVGYVGLPPLPLIN